MVQPPLADLQYFLTLKVARGFQLLLSTGTGPAETDAGVFGKEMERIDRSPDGDVVLTIARQPLRTAAPALLPGRIDVRVDLMPQALFQDNAATQNEPIIVSRISLEMLGTDAADQRE